MNENPYAAPRSTLTERTTAGDIRLYSPQQAAGGAFLGGPVGVIYFIWANFRALGNEAAARSTLGYGLLGLVVVLILVVILPEGIPNVPFTIAYVVIAQQVVTKLQVSKQQIIDTPEYDFHSNWRVLGLGLLSLLGSIACLGLPLLLIGA